jgi:hypothetical protein
MFCPNCGAADQNSNAYCRRCGEWLADPKSTRSHGAKTPEDRMKTILVFSGLNAVFALVSAIALYATYLGTPEAKWSVYLAGAFSLVIAVHQTVSFSFAFQLMQKLKRGRAGTGRSLESKAEGDPVLLGSAETAPIINAPSVTENTTDLLESSPRRNSQRASKEG